jgi:DNA-binding NtrC family response regulator
MKPKTVKAASRRDDSRVTDPSWAAVSSRAQRILVADDDEDIRKLMSSVLAGKGFVVKTAANGEEAWEAILRERYDLLVTDNEMPRLPGWKLVERIREAGMSLPVVIASGFLPLEKAPNHTQLQIAAVIPKPFDIDEFCNIVITALRMPGEQVAAGHATVVSAPPQVFKPSHHHVLIVEDDVLVRGSLAAVLESEGYEVDEANDGMEAVSHVIEHVPDLVLLDLNMPHCDGWTAFSQLDRVTPLVPVIIITARPNQYEKAVQLGVDAFMEKPLNLPVLVRAIKRLTGGDEHRHVRRITNPEFVTQLLDHNFS